MQRELEALLAALAAEQEREARLIQEIAGILREASSARRRMFESLAIAVSEATNGSGPRMSVEQVSEALEAFRAGSSGLRAH